MTVSTLPLPEFAPAPMSPLWWVRRLHSELVARQPRLTRLQAYADGEHDEPAVADRASAAFRRILGLSPTNLCGLVVEATAERMEVQGFRFGDDPAADEDAWRIWQSSDMDAASELAMGTALRCGRSFVLVEPPQGAGRPAGLFVEDPRQVIVAYAPGSRTERLAALKVWHDEWTGELQATLYLPGSIHRFSSMRGSQVGGGTPWAPRSADAVVANPLGVVPVFELRNRPGLDGSVMAEHADVIAAQDRANHIALNTLIALEFGAFRQKWVSGIEIPRDPTTGQPIEPFDVAVNRILVASDPDTKFGDFNPTDVRPYIDLYESTVKYMAAVTRTPPQFLLGAMANLSAEALAAAEAGLVRKVQRRQRHYEQAFESAMRLAFAAAGDPRADATNAETVWASAEIKSDAQVADAAVKLVQASVVTPQTAQEKYLGMSETERARDAAYRDDNDSLGALTSLLDAQAQGLDAGAFGG